MRNWINLTESMTTPTILYHGTKARNREAIEKCGLTAKSDVSWNEFGAGVYLANTIEIAEGYGEVIFAVDLGMLNMRNMVPDDHELRDYFNSEWGDGSEGEYEDHETRPDGIFEASWLDSLRICGQCQYVGDIPAEALKLVR